LVGDALFELLVQFHYLFCSLAQFFQKSRVLDSDNRLIGDPHQKGNISHRRRSAGNVSYWPITTGHLFRPDRR
jgi:hypothetical protein